MSIESSKGVWKSGPGRGRVRPKGRQLDDLGWSQVQDLLGQRPRRRDLLIEFLHLIQDAYGHLSAAHLRALAEDMRLSQAEVYERSRHFTPILTWSKRARPRRRP